MKLLIVEDSEPLRRSLCVGFENSGYTVEQSGDGAQALSLIANNEFDLVVLDIMLPSVDGLAILKSMRASNSSSRVIILSAKARPDEKVNGLMLGADDYLSKPFLFDELLARVQTVLRRGALLNSTDSKIVIDDFELDTAMKCLNYYDNVIELTRKEYQIINCLFSAKGKIVTINKISEMIVGDFDMLSKSTIEVHISAIKKKVRKVGGELPIRNKRGFGYIAGG
ncbi:MAG: response regulator transcription factor [Gammaproteobacteria bacterium]|nr:response regulator transcription factor [Gammaproteobacteria bacterium]